MSNPASDPNGSPAGPAERLLQLGGRLLTALIDGGHTRAELLSLELAIERGRFLRLLLLLAILIATGVLGSFFLSSLIIIYFWDNYRLLAAGAVTGFYLLVAAATGITLLRQLRSGQPPFAQSINTFKRDLDALRDNLQQGDRHGQGAADLSSDADSQFRDM